MGRDLLGVLFILSLTPLVAPGCDTSGPAIPPGDKAPEAMAAVPKAAAPEPAAPKADIGDVVCGLIAKQMDLDRREVTLDKSFADLGADDLDVVEMVMEVEDRFKVEISDEAIDREVGTMESAELPKRLKVSGLVRLLRAALDAKPRKGGS